MYGSYLLLISSADLIYQGQYTLHHMEWRSSIICHIAGGISTLSFLMSCCSLSLIALTKYFGIVNPISHSYMKVVTKKSYAVHGIWIINICITLIGMISPLFDKKSFISSNAFCVALLPEPTVNINSMLIMFTLILLIFSSMTISVCYIKILLYSKAIRSVVANRISKQSNIKLLIKIIFITVSNVLCWLPYLITSLLVLCKFSVDNTIITVLVTLIIPINCAVNPVIYSMKYAKTFQLKMRWI